MKDLKEFLCFALFCLVLPPAYCETITDITERDNCTNGSRDILFYFHSNIKCDCKSLRVSITLDLSLLTLLWCLIPSCRGCIFYKKKFFLNKTIL